MGSVMVWLSDPAILVEILGPFWKKTIVFRIDPKSWHQKNDGSSQTHGLRFKL